MVRGGPASSNRFLQGYKLNESTNQPANPKKMASVISAQHLSVKEARLDPNAVFQRGRLDLWQERLVAKCSVQPVCTLSPWAGVRVGTAGASTQAPDNQAGFDQIAYLAELNNY